MLGGRDREVPVLLIVDVDRLELPRLEKERSRADSRPRNRKTFTREHIETGVLFEPRLEILRPLQHTGIVIDRRTISPIEPSLMPIDREERVSRTIRLSRLEFRERPKNGGDIEKWVGGVRHQVRVGADSRYVVFDDPIHTDEITTEIGPSVANEETLSLYRTQLLKTVSRVGVDDDLVDAVYRKQGVEHPAEQWLPVELAEVLARHPLTVLLHRQQRHRIAQSVSHRTLVCRTGAAIAVRVGLLRPGHSDHRLIITDHAHFLSQHHGI